MKKFSHLLIGLTLAIGITNAEPVVDESAVRAITDELYAAMLEGDVSVFEKYMYEGSRIVIDTDPSNSAGQVEVPYEQFMGLLALSLSAMQDADIHNETISIDVDEKNNQATIKEKTIAVVEMMGVKVRDESISVTTYGVVDGQIKMLSAEDQLVSTDILE